MTINQENGTAEININKIAENHRGSSNVVLIKICR